MAGGRGDLREEQQVVHIVAVPCPALSHISALMHLCKRLAADPGILISFVNVDSIHEQMQKHWNHPAPNIRLEQIEFELKIPNGIDAYWATHNGLFYECGESQLPKELSKLIDRLNSTSTDVACIVSDYFCPWTKRVADEFGIPRAIFWSGSASWGCVEVHIPELLARKHIFSHDPDDGSLIDYIGGLPPIPRSSMPLYLCVPDDHLWRDHSVKRSSTVKEAAWVLVNSFPGLEKRAFEFLEQTLGAEKLIPVGPLFLLSGSASSKSNQQNNSTELGNAGGNVVLRAEDDRCLAWLDQQSPKSVLYISFGSIAVPSKAQLEELAKALHSTKVPFVWVMMPELVIGAGLSEEEYREFQSGFGAQGLIVEWAPQIRVLGHASVGGFLTHCGWNSMLESMSFGVPMIGWPWVAEQNTNSKLMADEWRLGAALSTGSSWERVIIIGSEEIGRAIKLVMGDEDAELRSRVEMIRARCIEAVKGSDLELAKYIATLKAGKLDKYAKLSK